MKEAKIAIYIRLSLADEDTGSVKDESNSVVHQRMLIHEYLNRHEQLKDAPRLEFVDDGYTGTNTNRPGFQAMMKALRTGECNVLITKDFSRVMRDYTEMGNYLECVFPFLGVRYISINDGYDSDDYKGMTGGMDVVLRNIVYAAYSKDLSVKTTTAKYQMMKQGKYVGSMAPYGYQFHPTIRNKLALDPESSAVVRRIFDLALSGQKTGEIARSLNEESILTPGSYYRQKHPESRRFQKARESNGWTTHAVLNILTQYEYTGATVGHKCSKAGLNSRKTIPNDRADWFVVEGMHKAIVTSEEYEQVQALLKLGKTRGRYRTLSYPLRGLVHCGECRRAMERRERQDGSVRYYCSKSVNDPNATCPRDKSYMETDLERVVLNAIRQMLLLYRQKQRDKKSLQFSRKGQISQCAAEIARLQSEQARFRQEKLRLYEDYISEAISKESYWKRKTDLNKKLTDIDTSLSKLETTLTGLESYTDAQDDPIQALDTQYSGADALTSEMAQAFVKAVYVYPDSQIEIEWKFKDIFDE